MANELAAKVASASTGLATQEGTTSLRKLIESEKGRIAQALPKQVDIERFTRILLTEVRKNPKLEECTRSSFMGAVSIVSQLGLEVGSALGHAYILPYRVKQANGSYAMEATLIVGYPAYVELARRANCSVIARTVYENDVFDLDYGGPKGGTLVHKPTKIGEPGEALGYYCIATPESGFPTMLYMTKTQIEQRRIRAGGDEHLKKAWKTDYDQMAQKSVLLAMKKYIPIETADLNHAEIAEGHVVRASSVVSDFIDVDVVESDPELESPKIPPTRDGTSDSPPAVLPPEAPQSPSKARKAPVDTTFQENTPKAAYDVSQPTMEADGDVADAPDNAGVAGVALDTGQMRRIRGLLGKLKISVPDHVGYITTIMGWEGNPLVHVRDLNTDEAQDVIRALEDRLAELAGDPGPQPPT